MLAVPTVREMSYVMSALAAVTSANVKAKTGQYDLFIVVPWSA
jgi:hypothetical protein